MIAALLLAAMVAAGTRWAGLLIAGAIFTYQGGALSGISWMTTGYAVAALAVALFKARAAVARTPLTLLDLTFLTFVGYYCLTAAYAPSPDAAVAELWKVATAAGSMFILGRLCAAVEQPRSLALQVAVGLVVLGGGFAALFLLDSRVSEVIRLQVGDATAVGAAQAFPLSLTAGCFAIVAALVRGRHLLFLACSAATALSLYVSVLSGTRGVYVALAAALLAMLCLSASRGRVWLAILAIVLGALIASPFLPTFGETSTFQSGLNRLLINFQGGGFGIDLSGKVRLELQAAALRLWQDNPLLGLGLSGYTSITGYIYPHNVFVEVAVESGAIGLALFVLFILFLCAALLRQPEFAARVFFFGLFVASFVHMQLSFALFMAKPLFLIAGVAAAWAARPARSPSRRGTQSHGSFSHGRSVVPGDYRPPRYAVESPGST